VHWEIGIANNEIFVLPNEMNLTVGNNAEYGIDPNDVWDVAVWTNENTDV
jgi:hypothetical protein